ncbi:MAG: hypothetical protein ACRCWW_00415 [Scandinavium sp.]|uniref:hypothetical protein n=1 Tax=Scandinavium sp. TaxID=2830653 RepID=UPI003F2B5A9F
MSDKAALNSLDELKAFLEGLDQGDKSLSIDCKKYDELGKPILNVLILLCALVPPPYGELIAKVLQNAQDALNKKCDIK